MFTPKKRKEEKKKSKKKAISFRKNLLGSIRPIPGLIYLGAISPFGSPLKKECRQICVCVCVCACMCVCVFINMD